MNNLEDLEYQEGQLAVDIWQTEDEFVIQSTIGGVTEDDLEILAEGETIKISGQRKQTHEVPPENYLRQECYWGKFSRTIVLPEPIDEEKIVATLKNGILTIVLPKLKKKGAPKKISIKKL